MIQKRLTTFLLVILLVIFIGSMGYYVIFQGQAPLLDCIYMTVISITSVGYGEILDVSSSPTAKIFTMGLITFGMGLILYAISSITALFIEGELSGEQRRRRMKKEIESLSGHIVLVGGGETGRPLIHELQVSGETVVLVEQDKERIKICLGETKLFHVHGDPTEDETLEAAGIANAKGIVIALPQDKDTLFVTMTARILNPECRIVAQASNARLEPKLTKAGADSVVSPNAIGALRMASQMVRPVAVDFLDEMLRSEKGGTLRIHELRITKRSGLSGKTLSQTKFGNGSDILVLGLKADEEITFNPKAETDLEEGMTLVVMGRIDEIKRLQAGAI